MTTFSVSPCRRIGMFAAFLGALLLSPVLASAEAPFTIIALPDTQFYSQLYPATFTAQTNWIKSNQAALNIVFVTHEGDIQDNDAGTYPTQWANAVTSMNILDTTSIPYATCPGNHDTSTPGNGGSNGGGNYNNYAANFGLGRYISKQGFLAEPTGTSNNCLAMTFKAGSRQFLSLSLDSFGGATSTAFAAQQISQHPGMPTIITLHSYYNVDGSYTTEGQRFWDNVIKNNPQVFMVMCGHMHGAFHGADNDTSGKPVYEMLADYQSDTNGGNGYLRIITFDPDNSVIHVKSYSPTLGTFRTDGTGAAAQQFDYTGVDFSRLQSTSTVVPNVLDATGTYFQPFDVDLSATGSTAMPPGWSAWAVPGTDPTWHGTNPSGTSVVAAVPLTPAGCAGATLSATQTLAVNTNPLGGGVNHQDMGVDVVYGTDRLLGAQPTSDAGTILQLALTNATGTTLTSLTVQYDEKVFSQGTIRSGNTNPGLTAAQDLAGWDFFYSVSGTGGPWLHVLALNMNSTASTGFPLTYTSPAALIDLSATPLANGGVILLRWFEDNSSSLSPEQVISIDNVRVVASLVDTLPPSIVSASAPTLQTQVTVVFSEPVSSATATVATNYTLSGGASVSAATMGGDASTVVLTTSTLARNTTYTVTAVNVQDTAGNAILPPGSSYTFTTPSAPAVLSTTATSVTSLTVNFTKAMSSATLTSTANFAISGGVSVTAASASASSVTLTVSSMTIGMTYFLSVSNVQDSGGITLAPNPTVRPVLFGTGVFTENAGHTTASRFSAGLAPYGWWAPNGVSAHLWEEYRKFWAETTSAIVNTDPVTWAENSSTDPTKATLHNTNSRYGPHWIYDSGGFLMGPDGSATPSNAVISLNQLVDSTSGASLQMTVAVGFVLTSDVPTFLDDTGAANNTKHGDGYYGHISQIDTWTGPVGADAVYITMNINSGAVSNVNGREASGNTADAEGSADRLPWTVTASGAPGAAPWRVTSRIYDDGAGNKRLEATVGGWTGYFQLNLTQATSGATATPFKHGAFNINTVTPFIYLGRETNANTTLGDQPVYVTSDVPPPPPAVTLTAPTDSFIAGRGWQIPLSATTTGGSPGTVTAVEFFLDGGTDIGPGTLAGGVWTYVANTTLAAYGPHTVTARVTDSNGFTASSSITVYIRLPGDSNGDTFVDGQDYGIWQAGYQKPGMTFATGDFNGDHVVDGQDYGIWQSSYGHTTASSDAGAASQAATATIPMGSGSAPRLIAITPTSASVTLVFDSDVLVGAGAVEVSGLQGGNQTCAAGYNAAGRTLTLTFASALPADRYTIRVIGSFVVAADGGAALDGAASGTSGSDAKIEFTVE